MIFHDVALFIINNNYVFDSLQPHNILLSSKENSAPIKIADFGVATEIGEEGYVTSGKTKGTVTHWSMHPSLLQYFYDCSFIKYGINLILWKAKHVNLFVDTDF